MQPLTHLNPMRMILTICSAAFLPYLRLNLFAAFVQHRVAVTSRLCIPIVLHAANKGIKSRSSER